MMILFLEYWESQRMDEVVFVNEQEVKEQEVQKQEVNVTNQRFAAMDDVIKGSFCIM